MRCFVLAVVAWAAAGCGADCAQSADIQVTVAPNSDVDVPHIARLHVTLVVGDGAARSLDITPAHPLGASGAAFVLRPDPAPSPKYSVTVTVQAISADATLLAIGSESASVVNKGCNRMTVRLAALPITPPMDMSGVVPADMAGFVPPDMVGCISGSPDEDADGRANFCDLCPADPDSTPVDTDGDGVPDACDPDPTMSGNRNLYFEPFDTSSGHWSVDTVTNSYLPLDTVTSGVLLSNNSTDMLPFDVRAQTIFFTPSIVYNNFADIGLFVGTNANPAASTATGVLCALAYRGGGGQDTLDLLTITNGGLPSLAMQTPLPFAPNKFYRMRLTQRGNAWTCEAVSIAAGIGPATVTTTLTVTAPLFMSLRAENLASHFHSVVAETKLP